MKHVFATMAVMICLVSCAKKKDSPIVNPVMPPVYLNENPVNPNANQATQKVYDYLWGLSYGSTPGVIVGQNAGHGADYLGTTGSYNSEIVSIFNQSSKYPGMLGVDYEYTAINSLATLQSVNTSLAAYWNAGGLITINYSPRNILNNNGGPMTRNGAGQMNKILAGGSLRTAWLARLDVIAAALQDLQNKGVTVLWRPMQECNGPLFWYATSKPGIPGQSAEDYIAVWQDMYNYFTNTKGLNNLLWVFAPTGDPTDWIPPYPGNTFVDIVAPTMYMDPISAWQEDANTYKKIIGMSELGPTGNSKVDNMQFLTATATKNPQFAYFVAWHDEWGISYNNNASTMMNDSRSITRDKIPDLK